jgi:hypothetical protein
MRVNCQQTNLPKWEHGSQLSIDKLAKKRAWKPTVNSEESQNEGMEANGQIEKFAIILSNYNF